MYYIYIYIYVYIYICTYMYVYICNARTNNSSYASRIRDSEYAHTLVRFVTVAASMNTRARFCVLWRRQPIQLSDDVRRSRQRLCIRPCVSLREPISAPPLWESSVSSDFGIQYIAFARDPKLHQLPSGMRDVWNDVATYAVALLGAPLWLEDVPFSSPRVSVLVRASSEIIEEQGQLWHSMVHTSRCCSARRFRRLCREESITP